MAHLAQRGFLWQGGGRPVKAHAMNSEPDAEGERIAKVLSRRGVASRRDAERLIQEGRVAVNGRTITSPALNVRPGDVLTVDGAPVAEPEPTRLWLYHKPAGLVTSEADEQGRPTVFDGLPEDMPRVMSVGRLDLTSEGLLLLTNDGGVKRRLELPSTGWLRRYRVRINGTLNEDALERLRTGISVDGIDYQPMEVLFDRQQGANAWLTIGLREGKNREIRRAMEAVGAQVTRLIRISYGPFQLGTLEAGAVQEVPRATVRQTVGAPGGAARTIRKPDTADPANPSASLRKREPRATVARVKAVDKAGLEKRAFTPKPVFEETGEGRPSRADRPARTYKPRADGDAPRPTKPRAEGDRPAKPFVRKADGDRPARAYKPRAEGDAPRPYKPRAEGDRPVKPHARRTDGDRPARAYKPRGEGDGPRPAKPRAEGDRPARPYARKIEGDRPARTYKPRAEGDAPRPTKPRAEGDRPARPYARKTDGDRPARAYKPRAEGDVPRPAKSRAEGDRPARPYARKADGDRPARGFTPRGDGDGARRGTPRPPRPGGKPGGPPKGGRPPRKG